MRGSIPLHILHIYYSERGVIVNANQKKKAVKRQIRHKKKQASKQQYIERKRKREEAYHEDHANTIRILPKGSPPHLLYYGVKEYAMKMLNDKYTQPTSRLILGQEYSNERVLVSAWVAGIRTFNDKRTNKPVTRILLDKPNIHRIRFNKVEKGRSFDSHVWIDIKDIKSSYKVNTLHMSVGDMVTFTASTYEYRGKIEHGQHGIKYGLTDIHEVISGYPFFTQKGDYFHVDKIEHHYPRHKEWILRWKSPSDYKTQPVPKWLNDFENYKGFTAHAL